MSESTVAPDTATEAPQPEVIEDSAGLDAGFRKVRPTEDRPTSPATETTQEAQPEAAPSAEAKPEVEKTEQPTEPVVFAGLTEAQLKAQLAKASEVDDLRKSLTDTRKEVLGHVGQLRQAIKEAAAAKSTGAPIKVAKDMLKRLNTDGYEELADALAEDLSALLQAPAGATVDGEAIIKSVSDKFDARVAEINRETEKKLLTIAHPDWVEMYRSDDYRIWKGTLPAERQQQLAVSWDSVYLTKAFNDFKAWKANGAKAAEDSAKEAKQAQEKRLAAAVTPKGSKAPAPSRLPDAAGLNVGFKKVRPGA